MGGRTYRYYNFREYEGGAFSRYLEEMAGKGWYIDGYVFDGVWRFRKGKPSKRRYNAVLMPGSSSVDIDESGDTKMFRDFCTEAGWILEYGGIVWQIFYTEDESLLPIETDPGSKLEIIGDIMMQPALIAIDFIAAILLIALAAAVWFASGMTFKSADQGVACALLLLWSCIFIGGRISMICWYNKAVHAAESGASLNSSTLGQIKIRSSLILCGCSSRQFGSGQRGQLERPADLLYGGQSFGSYRDRPGDSSGEPEKNYIFLGKGAGAAVYNVCFILRQNNGDGEGDGKYHKNGKSHDLYRCNRYRRDCGVGISHYADCHALSR